MITKWDDFYQNTPIEVKLENNFSFSSFYHANSKSLYVNNVIFVNINNLQGNGGAINAEKAGKLLAEYCIFKNITTYGSGGSIYVLNDPDSSCSCTINKVCCSSSASNKKGFPGNFCKITITDGNDKNSLIDSSISDIDSKFGDNVYLENGNINVNNNNISFNKCSDFCIIDCWSFVLSFISYSSFVNNSATESLNGIFLQNTEYNINNINMVHTYCKDQSGCFWTDGIVVLESSTLLDNNPEGNMFFVVGALSVKDCTLDNTKYNTGWSTPDINSMNTVLTKGAEWSNIIGRIFIENARNTCIVYPSTNLIKNTYQRAFAFKAKFSYVRRCIFILIFISCN